MTWDVKVVSCEAKSAAPLPVNLGFSLSLSLSSGSLRFQLLRKTCNDTSPRQWIDETLEGTASVAVNTNGRCAFASSMKVFFE